MNAITDAAFFGPLDNAAEHDDDTAVLHVDTFGADATVCFDADGEVDCVLIGEARIEGFDLAEHLVETWKAQYARQQREAA